MNVLLAVLLVMVGIIVFTEIIFIDKKSQHTGIIRHSLLFYDRSGKFDYEDVTLRGDNSNYTFLKTWMSQVIVESQLPPYPSNMAPTDGSWQEVNGTIDKFYVYSAFFDRRKEHRSVRIIAITKTNNTELVWCRLWYHLTDVNSTRYVSKTIIATVKGIRDDHYNKHTASFVLCPLQANQPAPAAVSIVGKILYPAANLLFVNDNCNATKPINAFGICLQPIFNEYNQILRLLEFLELNHILGVAHFTIYNYSIGHQVDCILKDYIAQGLITSLSWKLDIQSIDIWTKGIFAAFNDCLYRSMYRFSHILIIDIDEFIIPRHNYSLPQLVHYLDLSLNVKTIGSYNFRNGFFYLEWNDDEWVHKSDDVIATNLSTLKKTRRAAELFPYRRRSKYICRPEVVVEAGNHFVWEFVANYSEYYVPEKICILQHYRAGREWKNQTYLKSKSIIDTTALRYRVPLVDVVKKQFLKLKDKCNLEGLQTNQIKKVQRSFWFRKNSKTKVKMK